MKILTVIGARPQFIKAAAVSKHLSRFHEEIIVHTGQHYDSKMSDIFFDELGIPAPNYNLAVGSSTHAKQTAEIMIGLDDILSNERPDSVLVYGDTNSTLAGALVASKLNVPLIHVEAGLRSNNMLMPEEQNRILTDHISSILFCPTQTAVENLAKEGVVTGVYNVGDVMYDATLIFSKIASKQININKYLKEKGVREREYYVATVHRAENTDSIEKVQEILISLNSLNHPTIFPVHPRIKKYIDNLQARINYNKVIFIEPVGYLEMLLLVKNSIKVITDSGGLQKEAYFLEVPCITLREQTEWIETLKGNWNTLCPIDSNTIIEKVHSEIKPTSVKRLEFGNGNSGEEIAKILNSL